MKSRREPRTYYSHFDGVCHSVPLRLDLITKAKVPIGLDGVGERGNSISALTLPNTFHAYFSQDKETVSGTCEISGLTDFSTTHCKYFTQLITDQNSISSRVPGTFLLQAGHLYSR
jgi:hypothetical protein